ncbi:MAG: hypothetical protein IIX96_03405, partial [Clostridia bacterium]|nr:hypothetical protein [Clostridia bacterium]
MQRILKEAGFSAADILPLKDFKFLYGREMKFNERKMSAIIKTVEEKILPSEFPIIPLSAIRAYKTKGARGPFESRYFKRRTDLIHLLLAEMYKREGRYVERIADTVWAMLEESTWPLSAHLYAYPETRDLVPNVFGENATMHNIDLFAASTGAELALVYTYLKDELDAISPTIYKRIRYEVRERIVKPYLNRYYDWMGIYNPTHSNWCAWITSNILMVAPVFSDDDNEYRRIVERAMHSLDTFIESNNADGGCEEGPGYWGHAVAAYFDSLCTLYDMSGGKINVFDNEYIRKIGEYIVDFNIADNLYLNFADARYKIDHDGALIKDFGDRCGSAAMRAQGAFLDKSSVGAHHANLYRALRSVTTEDFPDCEQASAKTEAYYDVIKVMIARETDNKKQGFFLGIKGGHNGELHNHDDIGCFVVHHNGEAVI